jgi:RimJ/RimL family protein N-acetyltransferase
VSLPAIGSSVRLRDVTIDDADLLDAWAADPDVRGEFNDFGLEPSPVDREALAKGPFRNERNGELMIERIADGKPIGSVSWHGVGYGPNAGSAAWNIGISLISEARGHGFGAEAQRLLADYLFDATEFDRVEASTDVDNVAEQRSLERAGFIREGLLRGAQERSGVRDDLINYARLRSDPKDPL